MPADRLKDMTRRRDIKLGSMVLEFATPGIGQILKGAGCDYAFFDMEHSGFSFDTVKAVLKFMQAADLPTIVRVPCKDYDQIARLGDVGAEGFMTPFTSTPEEVRHILNSMKYVPMGRRGVVMHSAVDGYVGGGAVVPKLKAQNERTTFFALIETKEGVKNADAIAAIDGVDCLWIGHFDLSCSLGIPGQFDHPDFIAACDTVVKAAKKHNRALGRLTASIEEGIALNKQGFDFICYSGDIWALQTHVKTGIDAIRAAAR